MAVKRSQACDAVFMVERHVDGHAIVELVVVVSRPSDCSFCASDYCIRLPTGP